MLETYVLTKFKMLQYILKIFDQVIIFTVNSNMILEKKRFILGLNTFKFQSQPTSLNSDKYNLFYGFIIQRLEDFE